MNITPTVQELWSRIQALPADQQRWLADKLYEEVEEKEEENAPCQYTAEEMRQRLLQVETRILQGDPGFSNEEVEKELLEEMPWLK